MDIPQVMNTIDLKDRFASLNHVYELPQNLVEMSEGRIDFFGSLGQS